jgi:hypothetical protein
MRHDTLCDFLEVLRGFSSHDIGALELTKRSGKDERFCRQLLIQSGASKMRIGQAYYYKVSEIIDYIENSIQSGKCDFRKPPVKKAKTLPGPSVETARQNGVQFCKDLKARGTLTFTSSQLSGTTGLSRDALAKLLLVVTREMKATTLFYSVESFLALYARPGELSPDVCKVCGSLPEPVELMSVSGVRCSNLACKQHLRAFLTNDWVRYGSKKQGETCKPQG